MKLTLACLSLRQQPSFRPLQVSVLHVTTEVGLWERASRARKSPLRLHITHLVKHLPNLTELHLAGPHFRVSQNMLCPLTRLKRLQTLSFEDVTGVTPRLLTMLAGEWV